MDGMTEVFLFTILVMQNSGIVQIPYDASNSENDAEFTQVPHGIIDCRACLLQS